MATTGPTPRGRSTVASANEVKSRFCLARHVVTFVAFVAAAGCRGGVDTATHLVVGERWTRFPVAGAAASDEAGIPILQAARAFDLIGDTLAIADQLAGRIHLFDLTGRYFRALGGPVGSGPEVLQSPVRIVFGPDRSLWVGDGRRGRIVRFGPDLEVAETIHLPSGGLGFADRFAVDPVLGIITASMSDGHLLAALGEETLDIPSQVPIPGELAFNPVARAMGFYFLSSRGEKELVLVDDQSLTLWRVQLEYAPLGIVGFEEIVLPQWLLDRIQAGRERTLEAFRRTPGHAFAFRAMRATRDGVWLEPAGSGIRGVLVPYDTGDVTVLWRADEPERNRKNLVRDGVAYVLDGTGVSLYEVIPAPSPP